MTVAGTWGQGVWAMLIELLTFVSLGIFFFLVNQGGLLVTKHHYFQLLKCLLGCTLRNNTKRTAPISIFRLDFCRYLYSGPLALAPFLNNCWYLIV